MRTYTSKDIVGSREVDPPGAIEKALAGVVFLFASGLFDPDIVPKLGPLRINDVFMSLAAGVGVTLLFTRLRRSFSTFEQGPMMMIFIFYGFVGVSIFWSGSPITAVARYIGFMLTTLWTLYAATRFSLRELLTILLTTLFSIALISTLLAIAVPDLGIMGGAHKGDWKGIYDHKNNFGRNMALLFYVAFFCMLFSGPRLLGICAFALGGVLMMLSGSRTASVVGAIGIVSVLLLVLRRRPWVIVLIAIGSSFAALTITLQSILEGNPLLQIQAESLDVFSTQITFTGRFGLWQFALEWIQKSPWFGYGFDGFWKVKELGGKALLLEGWAPQDSHNGIIDILLQTGIVGLILYVILYFSFLFKSGLRIRRARVSYEDLFAALIMFVFLFANLTESYLLKATSIFQLMFTYSLILLIKKRHAPRRRVDGKDRRTLPIEASEPTTTNSGYGPGQLQGAANIAAPAPQHSYFRPKNLE